MKGSRLKWTPLVGTERCVSQTPVTDNLGRKQNTYIINESGLYNVILRSDKPASSFRTL